MIKLDPIAEFREDHRKIRGERHFILFLDWLRVLS